ncbi:polyhydroxyalkanoic acid system family protein [Altererythrobacter sp. TH136]|uniref:polyhydroxyalkanoic acid system family protein n=1 Tax=Altererythrobacter sp. TH136 TaxID=2067415 RepID=UPI0011651C01|nr:polyhydroxyalkanoic acid system family protein [Altererythrobacter sp. TH136]QDM41333.1 hypothetical protein C0V74_09995 [Altererythrobacter sp. TH136]
MRVAIPHTLENDVVRDRLKSKSHKIADSIPGGGTVRTMWPSENRMTMDIMAMGQTLHAHVDLEPGQLVFEVPLPAALSFVEPMIASAIQSQGKKLVAPPKDA